MRIKNDTLIYTCIIYIHLELYKFSFMVRALQSLFLIDKNDFPDVFNYIQVRTLGRSSYCEDIIRIHIILHCVLCELRNFLLPILIKSWHCGPSYTKAEINLRISSFIFVSGLLAGQFSVFIPLSKSNFLDYHNCMYCIIIMLKAIIVT